MSHMDRSDLIRELRDAADLVAIVQEKVKLRKTGSGWMGPCPIHGGGARTPCFSVLPEKGQWHCFQCNAGGDAIDFIQQTQNLSFDEALEELSTRTGIKIPAKEEKPGPADGIARVLSLVQEFYVSQLQKHPAAMAYLLGEHRGLKSEIVAEECLGYAPAGWTTTIDHLGALGIPAAQAEAAGITGRTGQGKLIDMLRDRLTIPIRDARGRIIAFAGRSLPGAPEDSPKYLNSRESPLFKKGAALFHLNRAKAFLREEGAVIVEGYFDAVSMCAQGIQTAVAPMGTALTEDHLNLIGRWTHKITLAFDGDSAGRAATSRALELALPLGFDIHLLRMPEGHDPDTWARSLNGETRPAVQAAPDWGSFALARAKVGKDLTRLEDRLDAAREIAKWIVHLPLERQEEVRIAAAHDLNVAPENIKVHAKVGHSLPQVVQTPMLQAEEAVQSLLALVARGGAYLEWVKAVPRSWWEARPGAVVLENLLDLEGAAQDLPDDQQALLRAAEAREATQAQADPKRLLARLEKEYLQHETIELTHRLGETEDEEQAIQIQRKLTELRARSARLTRGTK
jgi:DNA primase